MAHTILVRLELDDEYADIHPDIAAMDYLEGSKAHGWEVVTERLFTESQVKAMLHDMRSWISPDDGEEGRMWETRAKLHGIVLDPA